MRLSNLLLRLSCLKCSSLKQAQEALAAGADVVMLDNFKPDQLSKTAKVLKDEFPSAIIEGSGGITISTLTDYCIEGVDVLSMGSLTQGVPSMDISLKLQ